MKTNQTRNQESGQRLCLYPTFKEWKLYNDTVYSWASRLYPTFKEWKLKWILTFFKTSSRLYPTFKEWKREHSIFYVPSNTMFISYL